MLGIRIRFCPHPLRISGSGLSLCSLESVPRTTEQTLDLQHLRLSRPLRGLIYCFQPNATDKSVGYSHSSASPTFEAKPPRPRPGEILNRTLSAGTLRREDLWPRLPSPLKSGGSDGSRLPSLLNANAEISGQAGVLFYAKTQSFRAIASLYPG